MHRPIHILLLPLFCLGSSDRASASACHTIAAGEFLDPANWDCNCDPEVCDTLVIGHAVSTSGSLTIQPSYLHLLPDGALITAGDFVIAGTALIVNEGTMSAQRVLLYPCGKFDNSGNVSCTTLHMDGDTLLNTGMLHLADSLLGWPYVDIINHGDLAAEHIFGFLNHGNFGTESFQSAFCVGYNNHGSLSVDSTLICLVFLNNAIDGSIYVDSLVVLSSIWNEGTVHCRTFVHGYNSGPTDSQIYTSGVLLTDDFYNGPLGNISGNGDICIAEHSENHGFLSIPLGVCDATPTMSVAPFLDVNTGTFGFGVGNCANTICATVGSTEPQVSGDLVIKPNPASDLASLDLSFLARSAHRIEVVGAYGSLVNVLSGPFGTVVTIRRADLHTGLYHVIVRDMSGHAIATSRLVFMQN